MFKVIITGANLPHVEEEREVFSGIAKVTEEPVVIQVQASIGTILSPEATEGSVPVNYPQGEEGDLYEDTGVILDAWTAEPKQTTGFLAFLRNMLLTALGRAEQVYSTGAEIERRIAAVYGIVDEFLEAAQPIRVNPPRLADLLIDQRRKTGIGLQQPPALRHPVGLVGKPLGKHIVKDTKQILFQKI